MEAPIKTISGRYHRATSYATYRKWGALWPCGFEHWTGNWVVLGSNAAAATSLRNFCLPRFVSLSEETLKAVGPFYLVSMPGGVKDPTSLHWKCVTCHGLHHFLEKDNSKNNPVYNTQV